MAAVCVTCQRSSKEVHAIEQDYLQGIAISRIARKYNLGRDTVEHHCKKHMSARIVKSFEKNKMTQDFNMMTEFTELMADIKAQITIFKAKEHGGLTLKGMDTLIRLYGVMSQFASAYFQKEANDQKFVDEEQEIKDQEEQEIKRSKLTQSEQLELMRLAYKMNDMDYPFAGDHGLPIYGSDGVDRLESGSIGGDKSREKTGSHEQNITMKLVSSEQQDKPKRMKRIRSQPDEPEPEPDQEDADEQEESKAHSGDLRFKSLVNETPPKSSRGRRDFVHAVKKNNPSQYGSEIQPSIIPIPGYAPGSGPKEYKEEDQDPGYETIETAFRAEKPKDE